MKTQGHLLTREDNLSNHALSKINTWDLMHIVKCMETSKPQRKETFSFAISER